MNRHRPLVQSHEVSLPRSGRRLEGDDGVGPLGKLKLLAAQTNRTTGDQHHLITATHGRGNSGGIPLNRCGSVPPQQAGPKFHNPQGHAVGAPIHPARVRSRR